MNILIIAADFPPYDGGLAKVGYEYARAFSGLGHAVTVLAPAYGNDAPWDRCQTFEVVRYSSHKAFIVHYGLLRIKVSVLLRRKPYDWILCVRWNLDGLALGPKIRSKPAVFQWYYGNELFDRHLSNPTWAGKLSGLMEGAVANIAISNYTAGLLARFFPACPRVHVVHLGVDSRRFAPPASVEQAKAALGLDGKRVILSLARLVWRKGLDTVIKSLVHLNDLKDTVYVIAGQGPYQNALVEMVGRLGLEAQVRFAGFVPEEQKVQYYQACDIYAMPSRSDENLGDMEGFGLTYLEANACGKPVIGGRQGGCTDAVADGVSGMLVDPDDERETAAAITRLLQDRAYYRNLSHQGLERARKEFSWEKSCEKLLALYESCAHPNRPSAQ